MEQPPDLLTPLSEIIGYSDNESQSPSKWYLACRITLEQSVWGKKSPFIKYMKGGGVRRRYLTRIIDWGNITYGHKQCN
nr:hypothetical protein [Providencia alcalifaciens]